MQHEERCKTIRVKRQEEVWLPVGAFLALDFLNLDSQFNLLINCSSTFLKTCMGFRVRQPMLSSSPPKLM